MRTIQTVTEYYKEGAVDYSFYSSLCGDTLEKS